MIRYLFVCPLTRYSNALFQAYMGNEVHKQKAASISGVGTAYWLSQAEGKAVITMHVKGDYAALTKRILKAYQKCPQLQRLGVIHPLGLEAYMRAQADVRIPLTLFFLTDADRTLQFAGRVPPWRSMIEFIFEAPSSSSRGKQKRTKKKKKRALGEGEVVVKEALLKARKVDAEPVAEGQEDTACVVCMENKITHMCFPCTHHVLCGVCSTQLGNCPVCREKVIRYLTPIGK